MKKQNDTEKTAITSNGVLADSKKFAYDEAHSIAVRVLELLQPHCIRCEIAGSIRREKSEVKDIEIVAIPKPYQAGLFQDGIAEIVNQWQKAKVATLCRMAKAMKCVRKKTCLIGLAWRMLNRSTERYEQIFYFCYYA